MQQFFAEMLLPCEYVTRYGFQLLCTRWNYAKHAESHHWETSVKFCTPSTGLAYLKA